MEWISVKDGLPEKMGDYLVAVGPMEDFGPRIDVCFYSIRAYGSMAVEKTGWAKMYKLYDWADGEITHWMPLPEPPKPPSDTR